VILKRAAFINLSTAAGSSETLVNIYQNARSPIPEDIFNNSAKEDVTPKKWPLPVQQLFPMMQCVTHDGANSLEFEVNNLLCGTWTSDV
jgi:hypothetical protein